VNPATSLGVSAADSDSEDALVRSYDAQIMAQVRYYFSRAGHSQREDLEALYQDESQEVRIALLKMSRKGPLRKPAFLIRIVIRNRVRDALRRRRRHATPLPLEAEQSEVVALSEQCVATNEGARDPAYECELQEFPAERLAPYIRAIASLPASERAAVLWRIRECGFELQPVIVALRQVGLDPEQIPSPRSQAERRRYQAALSSARRHLRKPLGI
jgi:DNA-directed RNA polymerase specialized sigma24 family protein